MRNFTVAANIRVSGTLTERELRQHILNEGCWVGAYATCTFLTSDIPKVFRDDEVRRLITIPCVLLFYFQKIICLNSDLHTVDKI